jgi:hypothetical protein
VRHVEQVSHRSLLATPYYRIDWPFQEYCKRDIVAMRVIYNKLKVAFTPPPTERRLWLLD